MPALCPLRTCSLNRSTGGASSNLRGWVSMSTLEAARLRVAGQLKWASANIALDELRRAGTQARPFAVHAQLQQHIRTTCGNRLLPNYWRVRRICCLAPPVQRHAPVQPGPVPLDCRSAERSLRSAAASPDHLSVLPKSGSATAFIFLSRGLPSCSAQ